jgi:hypothetical protein
MPTRLTVVVATGLPEKAWASRREYRSPDLILSFHGPGRNFVVEPAHVAEVLGCTLPPRLLDLLEVAATVYAADIAFRRAENEAWVRWTRFLIPVREVGLWQSIEPELAAALYVLSHDSLSFEFCERAQPDDEVPTTEAGRLLGADCVSLLSGGIDSFAGAAMLLATGRRPLFVAHRPQNPMVVASQEHVCRSLTEAFGKPMRFAGVGCGPVPHPRPLSVPERGEGEPHPRPLSRGERGERRYEYPAPEERETSQRTRSFLYMVLGAIACHAAGVDELLCPENGVLAVNLPLTEARIGGYSTAGTRPQTLAGFQRLFAALDVPVRIENPFLYQTKGQLIRDVLRPYFAPEAIQSTVSCWMAGRLSRPCGACIPCLVRAVAMRTAGLPSEAHAVDPFSTGAEVGPESAARANLVDLLTLVSRLQRLSDRDLLRVYPMLLELAAAASVPAVIRMLRRFAEEVSEALGEPEFVAGA